MHAKKLSMKVEQDTIVWSEDHTLPNCYLHNCPDVEAMKAKILYARSKGLHLPRLFTKLPKQL